MNALSRRLLNALTPRPGQPRTGIEPRLLLDSLPPEAAAPPPRCTIEQLLAEGSQRQYAPMQEAQVLEMRRR